MIRIACLFALLWLSATASAGSIDSVNVGTEANAGTTYIKVSGGYTSSATNKIIKVDLVCTTDATKTESNLAAQLLDGSTYKRLSNNAVTANTFKITVSLYENCAADPSSTVTGTYVIRQNGANWLISKQE